MQCSASCWLPIIATITIVIQPIKSSANPKPSFDGRGEGEERRVSSQVKRQPWQIGKLICCFVLELEFLTFITATTYLPILEVDVSVEVNKMS